MWDEVKIINYLKDNLKEKRFVHSINVSKTAEKLALKYKVDVDKARLAGLVHDAAKNMNPCDLLNAAKMNNLEIDYVLEKCPDLLHGMVAAIIAKREMGIEDEDILNAVAYHTIGRVNMSTLEKIIYLADFIEPQRDFEGVESLREEAYIDLNSAVIKAIESSIFYVIKNGGLLHINSIEARNFLISER